MHFKMFLKIHLQTVKVIKAGHPILCIMKGIWTECPEFFYPNIYNYTKYVSVQIRNSATEMPWEI